jgi:hypothetical protein
LKGRERGIDPKKKRKKEQASRKAGGKPPKLSGSENIRF